MISYMDFRTLRALNEWDEENHKTIINIETIADGDSMKYRVWYKA